MFTCDQCGKRSAPPSHRTVTGRQLCDDCHARQLGAAAGMIAAGPSAPLDVTVTSALATSSIFRRLRRKRRANGEPSA